MLDITLLELFEKSIKENWDLPALTDFEIRTLNYSEAGKLILKLVQFYRNVGISRGDKIAVSGKNSINWALVYLSSLSYGAIIVPILSDFSTEDIQNTVNHSDARLLFADSSICNDLEPSKMNNLMTIMTLDNLGIHFKNGDKIEEAWASANKYYDKKLENITAEDFEIPNKISNEDIATIIYTSGTTGFSKGVILNLNSLTANVKYAQENFSMPSKSTIVSFLPLAHCFGCAFDFLYPFSMGMSINFLGRIPSPQILLDAFGEVKPILVFSVPLVIEKIYKTKIRKVLKRPYIKLITMIPVLKSLFYGIIRKQLIKAFGGKLNMIVVGGAAFNPDIEKFMKMIKLPVAVGYGMTECGPLISFAQWYEHKLCSVGTTMDYLEAKIDSAEPTQIAGELLVRGENVMMGYYKNEDATADVMEKDGWLHTGDLGTMDDDGFIYLKGRLKNLILGPSGQNIYPEEIESKLNEKPYVAESIIMDDSKHIIHALIYPDKDAAKKDGLSEDELRQKLQENIDLLNKQLPEYSIISRLKVLNRCFKRTPTQKIIRHLYKDEMK